MTNPDLRSGQSNNQSVPEHEKLFDEICNKLNELSHRTEAEDSSMEETTSVQQQKYEKMQSQMKKFNSELQESQEEIKEKIKSLGSVTYGSESMDNQVKQLAEQLHSERSNCARLSADLAKSLELGLQLQLEIQGLKARSIQLQAEERKYSQAMLDRNNILQREIELNIALKEEMSIELQKAKNAFQREQETWIQHKSNFEQQITELNTDKSKLNADISALEQIINDKDQEISGLNQQIETISTSFTDVENSAEKQSEVLKNLMQVAEGKIVEMKLALDKKSLEAQDYYSHLQQALTQLGVFKQENIALKDYINKLNEYHQQVQAVQQQALQSQTLPPPPPAQA